MNRRAKKARAKRRSQQWAAEKVMDALLNGQPQTRTNDGLPYVLRHGNTWTPDGPTKWFGQPKKECGCGRTH